MRNMMQALFLVAGVAIAATGFAQAPAGAPAGTTGLCKDGSYHSGATKKGACSKHGGVKEWYGAADDKAAAPKKEAATTNKDAADTKKEATEAAKPAAKPTKTAAAEPRATPAAGGGAGKVWVNTDSKVYHCQGNKWYGTTKKGEYMTEAQAKAAGNRADHGKSCS
ncbi:MAG TPA: DUF3761 domain-containing protein [Usitatibacter sp.]|jgi:uncharacterized protein DUF3761|nr:DUF3761 domain-containing protein [Usitatibacter sp.]